MVVGQWACGDSGLYKGVKIQLSENWVETKFCWNIYQIGRVQICAWTTDIDHFFFFFDEFTRDYLKSLVHSYANRHHEKLLKD